MMNYYDKFLDVQANIVPPPLIWWGVKKWTAIKANELTCFQGVVNTLTESACALTSTSFLC